MIMISSFILRHDNTCVTSVWLLPITVISARLLYESFLLLLFVAAVEFFLSSEDDVTRKGATGAIAGKSPDHLIFGFAIGSSEKEDEQDVSVGVNFVSDDDDDDDDDDGFVFVPMSKTKRTLWRRKNRASSRFLQQKIFAAPLSV
jgi:hypothetical protein